MLIFASVAALRLTVEWEMSYAALIPYATPGFVAFGVCAILAGWLADPKTAEGCFFSLPRGGKRLEGPSIRLAEICAATYGNLRCGSRISGAVTG